jgi:hypothetical protein
LRAPRWERKDLQSGAPTVEEVLCPVPARLPLQFDRKAVGIISNSFAIIGAADRPARAERLARLVNVSW